MAKCFRIQIIRLAYFALALLSAAALLLGAGALPLHVAATI